MSLAASHRMAPWPQAQAQHSLSVRTSTGLNACICQLWRGMHGQFRQSLRPQLASAFFPPPALPLGT